MLDNRMFWILASFALGFICGIGYDFIQTAAKELSNRYFDRYFKPVTLKNYIESTGAWEEIERRIAE